MQFRMIPNFVATCDGFPHQLWTFKDRSANQKKCRLRFVKVEKIKQLERNRGIWSVVEGKSQLARRVCPANRRSEELCSRIDATICGETRSSNSNRSGRFDKPGIHAALILPELQRSAPQEFIRQVASKIETPIVPIWFEFRDVSLPGTLFLPSELTTSQVKDIGQLRSRKRRKLGSGMDNLLHCKKGSPCA